MAQHIFALFAPEALKSAAKKSVAYITVFDELLVHRVYRILRLNKGDSVIFFDRFRVLNAILLDRPKKGLSLHIVQEEVISPPSYTLNVLLPLLKRDAFDAAVYACVQAGVRHICLVSTQRSHAMPKEVSLLERLRKVGIAAAEQSKQFFLPSIEWKPSLSHALEAVSTDSRLVANPQGDALFATMVAKSLGSVTITAGPEGGFSHEEHRLLEQFSFRSCALTKSILKADQAIALLAYVTSIALEK